jgi:protein transport protein SEC23
LPLILLKSPFERIFFFYRSFYSPQKMSLDVHELEAQNGVRFSWNVWPTNRLDATRIVVPLGCLYTPLKPTLGLQLVEYEPVTCRTRDCSAILNPYCFVDFRAKTWTCPFCAQRNAFPVHYAEVISEQNLPQELHPSSATIEYIIPQAVVGPPVFIFVIDTALHEEELMQLKDSLQQAISLMPPNALVGVITFGTMAYVHELGYDHIPKSYAFRGTKELTPQQVNQQLGILARNNPGVAAGGAAAGAAGSNPVVKRFLLPVKKALKIMNFFSLVV